MSRTTKIYNQFEEISFMTGGAIQLGMVYNPDGRGKRWVVGTRGQAERSLSTKEAELFASAAISALYAVKEMT